MPAPRSRSAQRVLRWACASLVLNGLILFFCL